MKYHINYSETGFFSSINCNDESLKVTSFLKNEMMFFFFFLKRFSKQNSR